MLEKIFGQHFRRLRKKAKLTQEQIAQTLGVDVRTVRRWENGEAGPEFNKLERIAQILKVSVKDLFAFPSPSVGEKREHRFGETHIKFQESQEKFRKAKSRFKEKSDKKEQAL